MYKSYIFVLAICTFSYLFATDQTINLRLLLDGKVRGANMIEAICKASSHSPLAAAVSEKKTVAVAIRLRNNALDIRCFDTATPPEYISLIGEYCSAYRSLYLNKDMITLRSSNFDSENQLVIIGLANNGKELRQVYSEEKYAVQD